MGGTATTTAARSAITTRTVATRAVTATATTTTRTLRVTLTGLARLTALRAVTVTARTTATTTTATAAAGLFLRTHGVGIELDTLDLLLGALTLLLLSTADEEVLLGLVTGESLALGELLGGTLVGLTDGKLAKGSLLLSELGKVLVVSLALGSLGLGRGVVGCASLTVGDEGITLGVDWGRNGGVETFLLFLLSDSLTSVLVG